MTDEIVRYKADNGQDIEVTEQDVRDLMAANGNDMDKVTSQEIKMFLRLCQAQRLNPFTRDAYIVKYGNSPASVIAGKDAFVKRATRNKRYRGHEAGITVTRKGHGTEVVIERREGSMLMEGETPVGGWCKVHVEGYDCPIFDEVAFAEYNAPDKYGKNGWSRMPATMIRKVALCHALREAFPEDLGGLYGAEEMDRASMPQHSAAADPVEAEVIVEDAEVIVEEAHDPRKDLWEEAADLKALALRSGIKESGIDSWMAASIVHGDGTPKQKREYTADDVARLNKFLSDRIADAEELAGGTTTDDYAPGGELLATEDIPF